MFLHEDKELFEELIRLTAHEYKLSAAVTEKDYYVTMVLKSIAANDPDIIFKGGTSLSKCYKIIRRFSEDIDLNIKTEQKPTEGQRRKLKHSVVEAAQNIGLQVINKDETHSRRDFNRYEIGYEPVFLSEFLKQNVICETAVFFRAYPTVDLEADCFIYRYLLKTGRTDIAEKYGLLPFTINTQSAERTLVDKLFAVADYYLSGEIKGHSRHIYDIACLKNIVAADDDFVKLLNEVREDRKNHKTCLSAQDGVDLKEVLYEIVSGDVYKNDYENITMPLLFDDVVYDEAIGKYKGLLDDIFTVFQ